MYILLCWLEHIGLGLTLLNQCRLIVFAMQRIIDRKVYDTDSAEQIAKHGVIVDKGDFHALAETLYKDSNGEYFLHCQGGAATEYAEQTSNGTTYGETLELLTKDEALDWCEKRATSSEAVLEEFAALIENVNTTQ
jgi:hypothetical protein